MNKSAVITLVFLLACPLLFAGIDEARKYSASAMEKFQKNDLKGALSDYNKSLEAFPDNAGALCNRGQVKAALGLYRDAIKDYNKSIGIFRQIMQENGSQQDMIISLAEAYFARGISRGNLNDFSGAIEDYNMAIKLNPNHAEAYFNRGVHKSDLKDDDGAIADYTKAIEAYPAYAKAYYNRALAKYRKRDHRGAIADLTRVIELEPKNADAYYTRGMMNKGYQDKADAISDLFMASQFGHPEALKQARHITGADNGKYGE